MSGVDPGAGNDKVYIHEFIDIIGHARADYMQHMAANWSPGAQLDRGQLLYGMWALLGSTGRWPQVVNLWEEDGWDGLASSFAGEAVGRGAQDPRLERWWAAAAGMRSGGTDRLMVPAAWSRPIDALCDDGVTGQCYAHDLVRVPPGRAGEHLEAVRAELAPLMTDHGWDLIGGFRTAMRNDSECLVLWAIPTWTQWAQAEAASDRDDRRVAWRRRLAEDGIDWDRSVLVDAPLCPLRTGRQPSVDDQVDWQD